MPPKMREMIDALIATPSVSAVVDELDMPNRPIVDLLSGWLEDAGFAIDIVPVTPDGKKANIIATRGRGPGGIVLSGHTDTVPFDAPLWESDPFKATERDGELYGLGSADMKSFLALAIEASKRVDDKSLKAPLIILATADEECGMDGARALVAAGKPKGRHAIIGEPTGLKPIRAHKGITMERLRLVGKSGHSSDPALGRSALEGMRVALGAIDAWRTALQAKHRRPDFHPPVATLNLGNVHGGDNPNRICGHCELQFDLRTLPGMDSDALRADLRRAVERAIDGMGLSLEMGPLHEGVPSFDTAETAAIVRAVCELTGEEPGTVAFGTEGPFLSQLGMETIVWGPGDIAVAHQPNEHIPLASLPVTVAHLETLIHRFTGT